jgi:hypothetical protein
LLREGYRNKTHVLHRLFHGDVENYPEDTVFFGQNKAAHCDLGGLPSVL